MIKEALEYILAKTEPHLHADEQGRQFADRQLQPVTAPTISALVVSTLSGFCDLVDQNIEGFTDDQVVALIEDFDSVRLVSKTSDSWARRTSYVHCQLPEVRGFPFGQFMDHESFIIGLQAHFTPTEDRDYLLRLASSLSAERVRTSEDDGVSQTVALRAGVVLKADPSTPVRARVTLAPFRTFREIEQPASEFIFRLRNAGESQPPTLALFEGDGGKWRLTAMENIGRYLRVKLDDLTVVV